MSHDHDLPGYYMPHCVNCMATSHSAHNCPYNEEEEEDA